MSKIRSRCSTCCSGGCYTALGASTCAAGYTKVYGGRIGGIEAYTSPSLYGKTLCVDGSAPSVFTWTRAWT